MNHCKRYLTWSAAFLLSFTFGIAARAAELVPPAKIDALAGPAVENGWIYGMAIGLINERGTQTAGYGLLSETSAAAPNADSVFEIGSITKVFTGLALAQMVEEHKVALTDPVQTLLGDAMKVPRGVEREIRLVDLSTHSSGLPRMPANFNPQDPKDPFADYSVEQLAEFLAEHKMRREPLAQYEYSNLAVGLLGHALALKDGVSWEEMVRQRICEPLSMNDTRITLDDDLRSRLARGHDAAGNAAENWHLPTLAGAGALRSTVNDMLKFMAANLGLAQTPFDPAIAASHQVHFKMGEAGGVALGWHVMPDGTIWHNGGTGGYHSFAGFRPDKKVGVVVLANSAVQHVDQLGDRLLDLLATGEARPLKFARSVKLDAQALEPLVGRYKMANAPKVIISRDGETLMLQVVGQPRLKLEAESARRFFTRADADVAITFEADDAGKVQRLVIHQNGQDHPAEREE
ncbi:MAG: serine hydrolase [Pirellulales bacterium]